MKNLTKFFTFFFLFILIVVLFSASANARRGEDDSLDDDVNDDSYGRARDDRGVGVDDSNRTRFEQKIRIKDNELRQEYKECIGGDCKKIKVRTLLDDMKKSREERVEIKNEIKISIEDYKTDRKKVDDARSMLDRMKSTNSTEDRFAVAQKMCVAFFDAKIAHAKTVLESTDDKEFAVTIEAHIGRLQALGAKCQSATTLQELVDVRSLYVNMHADYKADVDRGQIKAKIERYQTVAEQLLVLVKSLSEKAKNNTAVLESLESAKLSISSAQDELKLAEKSYLDNDFRDAKDRVQKAKRHLHDAAKKIKEARIGRVLVSDTRVSASAKVTAATAN